MESAIKWFKSIEEKSSCIFIQLDIAEFHPSITINILDSAITLAIQHTTAIKKDQQIKKH